MVKRSRVSSRPGQRRPIKRAPTRAPSSPATRPAIEPTIESAIDPTAEPDAPRARRGLTADEEARAAELERQLVAEERAAQDAQRRVKERARQAADRDVAVVSLEARAAKEYAYVRRDVRRIGLTSALLFGILAVLHVVINVLGLITI